MRTMKTLMLVSAASVALMVLTGVGLAERAERQDCPGTITCPQTGEVICRDQCPKLDQNRADCPGRVICPVTGKLVCADRCPLSKPRAVEAEVKPSCCRNGK